MNNPSPPAIRSFDQFRDAVYGFRLPRIILSAMDMELFSHMGNRAWTLPALARRLKSSQRGMDILCRNLAAIGLLEKREEGYSASKLSQRYLNKRSPEYRGAYLQLLQRQWEEWSNLTTAVKTGRPLNDHEPETPEYRRSFTWAMHERSMESAKQVARQIRLPKAQAFLDLGGGPGTYAMHFLKANPSLKASIMDRPAALEVARELATRYRLGSRLSYLPGDFLQDPITGKYDVVWYSNVLHIYSLQENLQVFRKARKALKRGGRLLIQDTFLQDKKGLVPLEANLFAVTMLLYTETGNTYSLGEVRACLTRAGFPRTRVIRLKQGTGDWEGLILEAKIPG